MENHRILSFGSLILQFSLLEGKVITEIDLPDAAFGNMAPYQWAGSTDFDISYDECGLWVIYATLQNSLDIGSDTNIPKPLFYDGDSHAGIV